MKVPDRSQKKAEQTNEVNAEGGGNWGQIFYCGWRKEFGDEGHLKKK